ncbi:hypothetical protein OVA24_08335 [Luteolibacter sp. SL250]|uniref:hypothetical protein n=1 Tax=Luteolibacter sp. SL250 TaxID=2995170 RepID=UPI00226FC1C8|nr:hypothetical protein [Luteolibacter sp. SL250]WAC21393.1 hypothetical protein OVA24_08335 [Luteolibacter sp. SL250]
MSVLQITIITIFGFITRVTAAEQNGLPGSDLPDWYFEYRPGVEGGRFLFYVGPNPLLLDPKLREHTPKTYSEAIRIFGPAFIHSLSGLGAREWNFSDGKRFRHGGGGLEAPFEAKLEDSTITLITVTVGKEGPAGESACGSESQSIFQLEPRTHGRTILLLSRGEAGDAERIPEK